MEVFIWSMITVGLLVGWLGYFLFIILIEKVNRIFNEWMGP
jgi:hypothetical protein